jgi:exodeoxyribonuclease VII large subunit
MNEKKEIFTVTALTKRIKSALEDEFLAVWVEGEISNFILHSSGHMYFTLKDADAQIQCVMFRGNNRSLSFTMENGIHVVICGRISVYERRGNYQLYADLIEPKGIGALQLAFEQLKERLRKEGLFEASHKKKLPVFPRRIGIVTSPTGAAIRDILQIVERRFSNVHIILNPVTVQGDGAAIQIARAIDEFNVYGSVDVLIVGRGGGSLEDLWPFNEEVVARSIFASLIPVISAVGHEIDYTISDFVADLRAPTPSAAAELVVKKKEDWEETIQTFQDALYRSITDMLKSYRERLCAFTERYGFRHPQAMVQEYAQRLDDVSRHMNKSLQVIMQKKESLLKEKVASLCALSPLAILERGYSITYKEGSSRSIIDSSLVHPGDLIITKLHNGHVRSRVIRAEES